MLVVCQIINWQSRQSQFENPPASQCNSSLLQANPSRPVIISDGFRDWPAMGKWSFDFFQRLSHCEVVVNDRAPARHADESSGGRQRSLPVSLSVYLQYVQASLTASTMKARDELKAV